MAAPKLPRDDQLVAENEVLLSQLVGVVGTPEAVVISATDHTAVMQKCRFITGIPTTIAATIKVDYLMPDGVTAVAGVSLPLGQGIIHVCRVTKVWKTGTSNVTSIYLHP